MAYRGGVDDSRRGVMSMTGTGVTALQPLRPGSATAAVERQEVLIAEVDVV